MTHYSLKPSKNLLILAMLCYALAAIVIVFYHDEIWMADLVIALIILLGVYDLSQYRIALKRNPRILTLKHASHTLDYGSRNTQLSYEAFRLFNNRWFMVVELVGLHKKKTLVLLQDRFQTEREYLDFRYQIIQFEHAVNAA